MTPQQLAGIKSGVTRRAQAAQRKNDFIHAVTFGASLTHNGVVSRHTYQKWRKADADFNAWLDGHIARMRRAAVERKAAWRAAYDRTEYKSQWKRDNAKRINAQARLARRKRQEFYERSALDVFSRANSLIGRNIPQDIRESAISELVLMMLEGHEPDAKHALRVARGEISYNMVEFNDGLHSG